MWKTLERKPRVLVVLAHFDETRNPHGRPHFVPQGVGHAFLAGAFDRNNVDVKLYSEFHSGPLLNEKALAWPDMLVLTGVTSSFDRMKQLTAYARTLSPGCVVVAGGPAVRNLPSFSAHYFDYACQGDVEDLMGIALEVFGAAAVPEWHEPRFDLLNWGGPVNYVESSRYCNFRCTFCALTGEGRSYKTYDLASIERQIRSQRRKKILLFVDNNFYGNDRSFFRQKLDLLADLRREGVVPGWIALVTSDFFADPDNLVRARKAGCLGLFSGVESLSDEQIKVYNKKQNLIQPQIRMIESCLEAGIVFQYGLIFDPSTQRLGAMRRELSAILGTPSIPLPAFLSLTIPLLGTPYFQSCAHEGRFLPHAKLRDMDGFTLMTKPIDDLEAVVPFVRNMEKLGGHSRDILRHSLGFYKSYRHSLSARQMIASVGNAARLCFPQIIHNRRHLVPHRDETLTYVTTTQPLGPLYRPSLPVGEIYRDHFLPTMITDAEGGLHAHILANATPSSPARAIDAGLPV
ncbi:B12-binding domain-containing radical SAM protein [Microvirga brassicacearum]|uniref:Radical SAM protein n=1 Tax=Microvirga brassicacearum TaxID=2580413 RepID=A0A5N3PFC2_9HYPH|nr:radical SAM protein [Microvirga brassicacearum]KAB0268345.1 radical SAM protein [Microvirga brassicacearum]